MRAPRLLAALLIASGLAAASHDGGTGGRSLGGAMLPDGQAVMLRLEAEDLDEKPVGEPIDDPGATGGKAWIMPVYGLNSFRVHVPETGVVWLSIRARGEHAPGLLTTHMHPVVDGAQRGEWDVGPEWATFRQSIPILAGDHVLSVDNFNNYHAPAPDRTLVVDWVEVTVPFTDGAPRVGADLPATIDGPEVHEAGTGMPQTSDEGANDGTSWHMWGIGCFGELIVAEAPGRYHLDARLRGNTREGEGSRTTVVLDGETLVTTDVGDAWETVEAGLTLRAGANVLRICYDNDYGGSQKRNLWLDEMTISPVDVGPAPDPTPVPPTTTPGPTSATPAPTPSPTGAPTASVPTPAQASPTIGTTPAPTPTPTESASPVPLPWWAALAGLGLAVALRRR